MARTFNGTYNTTQTLSNGTVDNPATVTAVGAIIVDSQTVFTAAILGSAGYFWTLANFGTVASIGTQGIGIDLQSGGLVINGTSGSNAGHVIGVAAGIRSSGGTVVNYGHISATGDPGSYYSSVGISFSSSVTVINHGVIKGTVPAVHGAYGILGKAYEVASPGGAIVNYGTIAGIGTYSTGIRLAEPVGDSLTNAAGALISGSFGVFVASGSTITNFGTIAGTGGGAAIGVALGPAGSIITNAVGGLSKGGVGIAARGVIDNFGSVEGTSSAGIYLSAGTLTNESGAMISSVADGVHANYASYVEFLVINLGTIEGSRGVYLGPGFGEAINTIVNFGTIIGTSGIALALSNDLNPLPKHTHEVVVIEAGSAFDGAVSGFNQFDYFILPFMPFDPNGQATLISNGTVTNQLQIVENGSTFTIDLDPNEDFAGHAFPLFTDPSGGTRVGELAPCFCRGTAILTNAGEKAVEALSIGDLVITASGGARPIKWIGWRGYDPRFIGGSLAVLPIRIESGALADGVPARDLYVSPEHALRVDGLLVPARLLVNGSTIRQLERVERLEYFHIELDSHDVIFAEGAPAENYVDCDNRLMFQNAGEFAALYPDDMPARWQFCAPRVEPGSPEIAAIRAAILARAEAFGRITHDPDLHLVVDGAEVRAQSATERMHRFCIPAGARSVAIASHRAVPAEVEPASSDARALGVAVERIVLCDDALRLEIGQGCPVLSDGFHQDEGSHRWTNGQGSLPAAALACFSGALSLEILLAETDLHYPIAPSAEAATDDIAAHPARRDGPVRSAASR